MLSGTYYRESVAEANIDGENQTNVQVPFAAGQNWPKHWKRYRQRCIELISDDGVSFFHEPGDNAMHLLIDVRESLVNKKGVLAVSEVIIHRGILMQTSTR